MVFRLIHGGVRENISLTAVIREWHLRNPSDELLLETSMPELFRGNSDLVRAGGWFKADTVIDFDLLNVSEFDSHPMDIYALAAFGDNRMLSRKMTVGFPVLPRGKTCAVVGDVCARRHPDIVSQIQNRFPVAVVSYNPSFVESVFGQISAASVFVGCNEDTSWLAMATDVPIVMLPGPYLSKTVRPFRQGIPFESIAAPCEFFNECVRNFSSSGFGSVFHIHCRREPEMACESLVTTGDVIAAINRIIIEGS